MNARFEIFRALLSLFATLACASTAHAAQRQLYVLTTDSRLATVLETQPGAATTAAVAITGLVAGDSLVAIDVRPQNGRLYGLGLNPAGTGTLQLYMITVESLTVRATAVGTTGTFLDGV